MNKRRLARRHVEEAIFKALMIGSFVFVVGGLIFILVTIVVKGLPALNLDMLTQTPKGGFYLGKEGGILNAIVGSLYLATGATIIPPMLYLPIRSCASVSVYRKYRTRRCPLPGGLDGSPPIP